MNSAKVLTPRSKPPSPGVGAVESKQTPASKPPGSPRECSTLRKDLDLAGSLSGSGLLPRGDTLTGGEHKKEEGATWRKHGPSRYSIKPTKEWMAPEKGHERVCDTCINEALGEQKERMVDASEEEEKAWARKSMEQEAAFEGKQRRLQHLTLEESKRTDELKRQEEEEASNKIFEERKRNRDMAKQMARDLEKAAERAFQRRQERRESLRNDLDSQVKERQRLSEQALEAQHPLEGLFEPGDVKHDHPESPSTSSSRRFTRDAYNQQLEQVDAFLNSNTGMAKAKKAAYGALSWHPGESDASSDGPSDGLGEIRRQQQQLASQLRQQMDEMRRRKSRSASTGLDATKRPHESGEAYELSQRPALLSGSISQRRRDVGQGECQSCHRRLPRSRLQYFYTPRGAAGSRQGPSQPASPSL